MCSSDQHKDVTIARQLRDVRDTLDLINFLRERDPFVQSNALINIANGMTAESIINVDRAKQIGENILESMVDNFVEEFTLRKANEVVTMSSRSAGNHRMSSTVNPQLIFQWIVLVGKRCRELSSLFKYELYCFPSVLFESSSLPLQPNKPVLANAL